MNCAERFLKYVAVSTPSDDAVEDRTPSTACQFDLANALAEEMMQIGFEQVRVDDCCFVYGVFPASQGYENVPAIGMIAHLDTATSFCGIHVKPQIISNYNGKDVELKGSGETLSVTMFPHLRNKIGQTLITTDGTTLLGADDKAGIAEIITACELLKQRDIAHGPIAVAFTPDEEIGLGIQHFDVAHFPAKAAYTVDGGEIGSFSYENFNACMATVEFNGISVHPGSAKDTMINANLLAMEFAGMLPSCETPRDTEKYEGFFHLEYMSGDAVKAKLVYIVRDHSAERFEGRKEQLRHIEKIMKHRWGSECVKLTIREQYRNMREIIEQNQSLVENVKNAMAELGMPYHAEPIRGGTDVAQLCERGLPCPNLCTGGYACHGPFEHITFEDLQQGAELVAKLCEAKYWHA